MGLKSALVMGLGITIPFIDLIVKIPKNIAHDAKAVRIQQEHEVIEDDPIIKFIIDAVQPGDVRSVKFLVDKPIDDELLESILVEAKIDREALLAMQRLTDDAMKISREFEEYEKDGEKYTRIKLKVNPKKELEGLSLYEKIPKCLAKHIDDIQMDEKHRQAIKVLNPDPLIMWQFDKMASEKEFSYEVKGVLSEDCKKQILAMGIADELGLDLAGRSFFRIILPLLLIPIVGMGVWFVEKRGPPGSKKKPQTMEEVKPKPLSELDEEVEFESRIDKEIEMLEKELNDEYSCFKTNKSHK